MNKFPAPPRKGIAAVGWIGIPVLSAIVIAAAVLAALKLPTDQYSPIAELVGATSSFLAVVGSPQP